MENTSKGSRPIARRERAYYRRRNQNRIHAAIAAFFAQEAEAGRITKKQLADLLEKDPAQVTRWLTDPGNYEADTISDLLLAMAAEMEHRVVRFSERGKANYAHPLITTILGQAPAPPKPKGNAQIKKPTSTSQPARQEYLIAAE
jgi:hypothetical protein